MKKISKNICKDLPPSRLYLDELYAIREALVEYADVPVEFELCGHQITNLDDVSKLQTDRTCELSIRLSYPHSFWILLSKHGSHISMSDYDLKSAGLITRIESIFNAGKASPILRLPYKLNAITLFIIYLLIIVPISLLARPVIFDATILIIFILMAIYFWFIFNRYNIIILKYRKDTPSFWKRNKDGIFVTIFSGLIVGLLLLVAGLVLKK